MFNLKEFIINNLIAGVKNKSFSKEYASILSINYLTKGIIAEEDIIRFDIETTEPVAEEVIKEPIENIEATEEILEENIEPTEEITEQET